MSLTGRHLNYTDLRNFLVSKKNNDNLPLSKDYIKKHIDFCAVCWSVWNRARWDVAEGTKGYLELEEFLGEFFYKYLDSSWALAAEWYEKKRFSTAEIAAFYKETPYYIYNSLIHYESGDRDDVSGKIKKLINKYNISSAIDYGCGIGTDGLLFLESSIFVDFIDYKNPSTDFLKWRLNKRNIKSYRVHNVEELEDFPATDMFWAYDVFEHMKYPEKIIDKLSPKTKLVVHESNNDDDAGGRHPFHFGFDSEKFKSKLKKIGFKKEHTNSTLEVFYRI